MVFQMRLASFVILWYHFFLDASTLLRYKSKSLQPITVSAAPSSQQGAACSAGKTQTREQQRPSAATNTRSRESLRSYGFCSALTEAASMWQQLRVGRAGCQSHRCNDRHNRLPHSQWTSEHHHTHTHTHNMYRKMAFTHNATETSTSHAPFAQPHNL